MKKIEQQPVDKLKFLSLYDDDGNPTEVLLGISSIYLDESRGPHNLFIGVDSLSIPIGLSSIKV